MTGVSPLTFRIALAAYTCGDPPPPEFYSAPGTEARKWLHEEGIIDLDGYITDKGRAWIERALSTPLPRATWTFDPEPKP